MVSSVTLPLLDYERLVYPSGWIDGRYPYCPTDLVAVVCCGTDTNWRQENSTKVAQFEVFLNSPSSRRGVIISHSSVPMVPLFSIGTELRRFSGLVFLREHLARTAYIHATCWVSHWSKIVNLDYLSLGKSRCDRLETIPTLPECLRFSLSGVYGFHIHDPISSAPFPTQPLNRTKTSNILSRTCLC